MRIKEYVLSVTAEDRYGDHELVRFVWKPEEIFLEKVLAMTKELAKAAPEQTHVSLATVYDNEEAE